MKDPSVKLGQDVKLSSPGAPATKAQESVTDKKQVETERVSAGQRSINRWWEFTQAVIALVVTVFSMWVSMALAMRDGTDESTTSSARIAFQFLTNTMFVIVGFYFGRTNHQKVGGVGQAQSENTR